MNGIVSHSANFFLFSLLSPNLAPPFINHISAFLLLMSLFVIVFIYPTDPPSCVRVLQRVRAPQATQRPDQSPMAGQGRMQCSNESVISLAGRLLHHQLMDSQPSALTGSTGYSFPPRSEWFWRHLCSLPLCVSSLWEWLNPSCCVVQLLLSVIWHCVRQPDSVVAFVPQSASALFFFYPPRRLTLPLVCLTDSYLDY